jgi:SsrA-binding protein
VAKRSLEGEQALSTNRRALFNYDIIEKAEAGVALRGTEVKAIREGGFEFRDAFVDFRGGELFLVGARVAPYSHGNLMNHPEGRDRKLLLHKREILKLGGRATEKGLTLVPLRAYIKNGRVKIEIGLGRGKKAHDKRDAIKKKDIERDARQEERERRR